MPTIARLRTGDDVFYLCADPSQLPLTLLLELRCVDENGEFIRSGRGLPVGANQRPDQMVECRPVIVDNISQDSVDSGGDGRRVGLKPPDMLKGIRVEIMGDMIRLTLDNLCDGIVQNIKMFMRTCYFRLNAVGSRRVGISHGERHRRNSKDTWPHNWAETGVNFGFGTAFAFLAHQPQELGKVDVHMEPIGRVLIVEENPRLDRDPQGNGGHRLNPRVSHSIRS